MNDDHDDLFGKSEAETFARARRSDPVTSHEAATSMEDEGRRLMWRVNDHIYAGGAEGATAEETSDARDKSIGRWS